MTDELTFIDTNILLYAYDRSADDKHLVAKALVASLWRSRLGVLSTQVLQEFYVNATRKLPHPLPAARTRTLVGRYATWPVHRIEPDDILEASSLQGRHRFSFWDALIVVAAIRLGATRLCTEDLQHGRSIRGLRIENPFLA